MKCPLCQTPLPDGATSCTRCDWAKPPRSEAETRRMNQRDVAAFWLSLVPGLGHLYKGHVVLGGLIFFLIGPAILALSLAVLPATLGLSIAVPAVFLGGVMVHAYQAEDRRSQAIEKARIWDQAGSAH